MAQFIDRRSASKNKSMVNRSRFIRRYRRQIKSSIADAIAKRSVTDIESGEQVTIPRKDMSEPSFHHGQGGKREMVHPGNKEFVKGDKIKRPEGGGGQGSGSEASNQGEGSDDFVFDISRDEYLELLFDGLELPNLRKNKFQMIESADTSRAGFKTDGVPANINLVRSLKGAMARRMAMSAGPKQALESLEAKLSDYLQNKAHSTDDQIAQEMLIEIEALKKRLKNIPYIDTFDLRYNNYINLPKKSSRAVMFCLMDVSGSMDQATKDMAKRFFILLYLFLNQTYKAVEVVFIRHHTQAKVVDEEEFFYSQETGGTIVSSALKLMQSLIQEKYSPEDWNIYGAQASDGDNWSDDSPLCHKILNEAILPVSQYFAYIEITKRNHQSLWQYYQKLLGTQSHFAMQHIQSAEDIYPIFRELFKKQPNQGVS